MAQGQAVQRRNPRTHRQEIMAAANQRVVDFQAQLNEYQGHLLEALPAHVPLARFKRVLVTAASMNPDLLVADRRTLFLAAIKCASDGLMPDGRQAALVVYNTKIKQRNPQSGLDEEFRIDAVQYMPMIAGIRERMRNTGQVDSADAQVVCKNDTFRYALGDHAYIEHEPPPLGQERGEIVGAYAIIKLKSGEVLRDVMSKKEIEQTRQVSRSPNSPMWSKFYGEAARKTVLRRCSKAAPQTSDLERLIGAGDDDPPNPMALAELSSLPAPEPQRMREDVMEDKKSEYEVIDLEGQCFDFFEPRQAAVALRKIYADAAKRGPAFLDGAEESNAEVQRMLEKLGERFQTPRAEPPGARGGQEGEKRTPPAPDNTPPFPGDQPPPRQSMEIPVPGAGQWRNWALALFLPRVRQMNNTADMAMLMGDNEKNLEQARRALEPADRKELDQEIEAQWDAIKQTEG